MLVGKVIGTVIATRKDEKLVGSKFLIVQPLALDGTPNDRPMVAVDTVGAGVGERVLYVTGSVSPLAVRRNDTPVDAAVVGIIDSIDIGG